MATLKAPKALLPLSVSSFSLLAGGFAANAQTTPLGASRTPSAQSQTVKPMRFRFINTDVSEVLSALGSRTRANIIYSGRTPKPISINITVSSVEEALRAITSAAGLAFRQIGNTFVVAPPEGLKSAIEPVGQQTRIPLVSQSPADAVRLLESALPYVTARPAGNAILIIGAPTDLAQARDLLNGVETGGMSEPNATDVVTIQNANAGQVATLIKSLYPNLRADPVGDATRPGGSIGLSGPRSLVEQARTRILALDTANAVRLPERTYRIYTVKYSSAPALRNFITRAIPSVYVVTGPENYSPPRPDFRPLSGGTIGTTTGSGGGLGGGSGGGTGGFGSATTGQGSSIASEPIPTDTGTATGQPEFINANGRTPGGDRAKSLVLSGTPADIEAAIRLLDQVDIAPKQVMVNVKVIDVSPQFAEALGLQYQFGPVGVSSASNSIINNSGSSGSTSGQIDPLTGAQNPPILGNFNGTTFGRFGPSFAAQISAVRNRTDSKLLADPRIQVIDNDDANIFIGDTIRTQVSQAGISGTTIQVLEFPVGIILLVRPRINEDGRITMRVHPVVSTVTGLTAGNIPQTSSREAETTVMVQNGETIVIGGLIRDEISRTVQEVPILSRIPILGELFRYRSNSRRRSEIMVFITPYITGTTAAENAQAVPDTPAAKAALRSAFPPIPDGTTVPVSKLPPVRIPK